MESNHSNEKLEGENLIQDIEDTMQKLQGIFPFLSREDAINTINFNESNNKNRDNNSDSKKILYLKRKISHAFKNHVTAEANGINNNPKIAKKLKLDEYVVRYWRNKYKEPEIFRKKLTN